MLFTTANKRILKWILSRPTLYKNLYTLSTYLRQLFYPIKTLLNANHSKYRQDFFIIRTNPGKTKSVTSVEACAIRQRPRFNCACSVMTQSEVQSCDLPRRAGAAARDRLSVVSDARARLVQLRHHVTAPRLSQGKPVCVNWSVSQSRLE